MSNTTFIEFWCVLVLVFFVHDDVMKWLHYYLPFLRGIHRWPVDSPHKGQWRGSLMFTRTNGWANNRDTVDLRRHKAHCDVTVMLCRVCKNRAYCKQETGLIHQRSNPLPDVEPDGVDVLGFQIAKSHAHARLIAYRGALMWSTEPFLNSKLPLDVVFQDQFRHQRFISNTATYMWHGFGIEVQNPL